MTESVTTHPCEVPAVRSTPPAVRLPKLVQGVGFAFLRRKVMRNWIKRHESFNERVKKGNVDLVFIASLRMSAIAGELSRQ